MSWTEERIETLKKLWAEGLSASQIKDRLTGVTRNAVIGKVHRLGLSGRPRSGGMTRTRLCRPPKTLSDRTYNRKIGSRASAQRSITGNTHSTPHRHSATELPPLAPPPACHPGVNELTPEDCRWPIGDPKQPGFHFCGRSAEHFRPYCAHHLALATSASPLRKIKPSYHLLPLTQAAPQPTIAPKLTGAHTAAH